MVRRMLLLGAVAGCTCPPVDCPATVEMSLDVSTWTPGTWTFSVTPVEVPLVCTIVVPDTGVALPVDVTCEGRVERGGFLFDTGGLWTPDHVVLRAQTLGGAVDEITVRLAHEGRSASEVLTVDWVDTSTWVSTCQVGCTYGLVEVTLENFVFSPSTGE